MRNSIDGNDTVKHLDITLFTFNHAFAHVLPLNASEEQHLRFNKVVQI